MQALCASIAESQAPSRYNYRRDEEQMQPRFRLEDSVVSLAVAVRVAVYEPATGPRTKDVSEQAGDVDQADDGGAEVVRCYLQQERGEDVDRDDPGERDPINVTLVESSRDLNRVETHA